MSFVADSSSSSSNTDDLLISGVEALSSLSESRAPAPPLEISGGPSTPESQRLPIGAEASSVGRLNRSSAIRRLDFAATSHMSTSIDVQKGCMRHPGSPQKSTTVSFAEHKNNETGVSEGTIKTLPFSSPLRNHQEVDWTVRKNELKNVMKPIKDLASKIESVMISERDRLNSNLGYALDKDEEFRSYVCKMNLTDCKDMLETEHLKRRHLERNALALQNRIMKLEERLCLSESMIKEQSIAVDATQDFCNQLLHEACIEQENFRGSIRSHQTEMLNLKDNLTLAKNYNHTLAKRTEDLEGRLNESNRFNTQYLSDNQLLKHQNDSLNDQVSRLQTELQTKNSKVSKLESENKCSIEKETELTKELLELEKLLKQSSADIHKLRLDLNSEKSSSKLFLEQKDREMKMNVDSVTRDKDCALQDLRRTLTANANEELAKLKNELQNEIDHLNGQYEMVMRQRDIALCHLAKFEEEMDDRKRKMCQEVQSKLADKYRELVAEFSRETPTMPDTGRTTLPYSSTRNDMQDTIADHFMKQLQAIKPISETQNTAAGYFTAQYDSSGRKSQLHSFLLQKFGNSMNTPNDPMSRK